VDFHGCAITALPFEETTARAIDAIGAQVAAQILTPYWKCVGEWL
jgi:hypothetical protein